MTTAASARVPQHIHRAWSWGLCTFNFARSYGWPSQVLSVMVTRDFSSRPTPCPAVGVIPHLHVLV